MGADRRVNDLLDFASAFELDADEEEEAGVAELMADELTDEELLLEELELDVLETELKPSGDGVEDGVVVLELDVVPVEELVVAVLVLVEDICKEDVLETAEVVLEAEDEETAGCTI